MKKILLLMSVLLLTQIFAGYQSAYAYYNVTLTSNPPATASANSEFSKLNAKVGDVIIFSRSAKTDEQVVNSSWQWNWDNTKLNCFAYPEFDSFDFKCTVLKEGTSDVSVTIYPVLADGSKLTNGSNIITVVAQSAATQCSTKIPYEKDGKFIIEAVNCKFTEFTYVVESGSAKLLSKSENTLVFDNTLKGVITLKVTKPTPFESTFDISGSSASTASQCSTKIPYEKDGKFIIEAVNCKFSEFTYVVLSGTAKLLLKDENTLVFDNTLKGVVTIKVTKPIPFESTFDVKGSAPSTTPVQCYARTVEGDGKYLIELKGGNDRTEACRFYKWHYDILSGQAKNIATDQYTATFDDTLKGTIKIVVVEPTPFESTFIIGSRYTGATSSTEGPTIPKILDTTPKAGYEDEVLTAYDQSPFTDTDVNSPSGRAAAELYRRGVIGGYADGEFKGSRAVNRAEAAKFLLLARYGEVEELSNNGKFWDVLDGQWYTKFVVKANQLGIIMGYADGSFKPANTVSTAEFVKMLTKTFDLPENLPYDFVDVQPDDWFAPYAGIAQKYNLFPNHTAKLLPQTLLARDEVAVAIYQYLKNR